MHLLAVGFIPVALARSGLSVAPYHRPGYARRLVEIFDSRTSRMVMRSTKGAMNLKMKIHSAVRRAFSRAVERFGFSGKGIKKPRAAGGSEVARGHVKVREVRVR